MIQLGLNAVFLECWNSLGYRVARKDVDGSYENRM